MSKNAERLTPPEDSDPSRLSRITTLWTLVREAHAEAPHGAPEAQQRLWQCYCGAAYRYLLGALRNKADAEELFQEFALRFVRGDFRRAMDVAANLIRYNGLVSLGGKSYKRLRSR